MPSSKTIPFQLNDPVFANLSGLITQAEINLINSSSVLLSLLHAFADTGLRLVQSVNNQYTCTTLEIGATGMDLVRILGHELGHFWTFWGQYIRSPFFYYSVALASGANSTGTHA